MTAEEIAKYIQDEKVRQQVLEALKNEYLPKADFTKATQAKADELKAVQEKLAAQEAENRRYMEWYYGKYEPWMAQAKAEAASRHQASVNPNPTPANPNENWWDNWDILTPQQQAQALHKQQISELNQSFGTWTQQFAQNVNNLIKERETYYQDYLSLYIDANEKKRQNPDLDIQKYMTRALELKTGKANPMETAYTLETLEKDKEKWLEEGRKHGRQEAETEYKAKRPTSEPSTLGGGPEPFKPVAVKKEDRMAELKAKVGEKFGPQVWAP